ncbi:hypothetical protein ACFQO7_05195 [Catellatospora aurea]|uniref:DUF3592 domain-containing protein n=1 Tax=Catellatospora aurea TaxID=1337874 RepID=A0ABW2GQM7_9ACTN
MPAYEPIMDTRRPWSPTRLGRAFVILYLVLCVGLALFTLARGLWLDAYATPARATVVDVATNRGLFITVELPDSEYRRVQLWTSRGEVPFVHSTMLVEYAPDHPGLVREAGTFAPLGIFYFAACSLPVCLLALFLIRRHLRSYE